MTYFYEMLDAIETEYGKPIARVVKFEDYGDAYYFTIIFEDYTLLEAQVKITHFFTNPSITIEGKYF